MTSKRERHNAAIDGLYDHFRRQPSEELQARLQAGTVASAGAKVIRQILADRVAPEPEKPK